jgi:MFS family permease
MTRSRRTFIAVLLAATCIISLSVGIRATLGLFLRPMTLELHWSRAAFGIAIAIQNLVWGLAQPFTGMLADRYGTGRVLAIGGVGYALGLYVMSLASTPEVFTLGVGLLNGMSISRVRRRGAHGSARQAHPGDGDRLRWRVNRAIRHASSGTHAH